MGPSLQACLSDDASLAAAVGLDRALRIWDVATGKLLGPPRTHPEAIVRASFRPDHLQLATICMDGKLRLFSPDKAEPEATLEVGVKPTWVGYSHDGSQLAVTGQDGSVTLFVGQTLARRWVHANFPISTASFSPDGKLLATALLSGDVRVFDTATGQRRWHLVQHTIAVWDMAFSPDGKRFATCSSDCSARVWSMETGQPLSPPLLHQGPLLQVAFSPNGRWLATACKDRQTRVWDAIEGQMVVAPVVHTDIVWSVRFNADGHLLSASRDGQVIDSDLSYPPGRVSEKEVSRVTGLRLEERAAAVMTLPDWQALQARSSPK